MSFANLPLRTLYLYLFIFCYSLSAQDDEFSLRPSGITNGETYAVIIGISKYQHIDSLRFAHRDAEIFASFLQSDAGGNVPTENIKLLTDEQATISNIYIAKQWLEDIANEDDLVYFYFAGHGDVESSLYKLGFLLAYDTPKKNYFNNAVRIEDINIMANTLSVTKKAKVMLITDACHSGKLAGSDNRGTQLVGDQLTTATSNEVRIASCAANQLSQEDEFWGGGRGAFSFHLINGLKGLADDPSDPDSIVSLLELQHYVTKNVTDDVSKEKRKAQTPVILGDISTKMAIVDQDIVAELKATNTGQGGAIPGGLGGDRSVERILSAADIYFKSLSKWDIDSVTTSTLAAHPNWDIVSKVKELFPNPDSQNEAVNTYLSSIEDDPALRIDFNRRLAATIHDQCQAAINAYLAADSTELNRRQYYSSQPSEFEHLAEKLDFARTLISDKNYLHQIMQAKSHYYNGIAKRLTFTQTYNDISLLDEAITHQLAALSLDNRASYVHNEMGILYRIKGDVDNAEKSWLRATELTPGWALPFSNLSNLYHMQEKYEKGSEFARQAIELEDTYFMAHIMLAWNTSSEADYLSAEEHLRKSVELNNSHYLAYQDLGYLYTNTLDYQVADSFFFEAEKRKVGIITTKDFPIDRILNGGTPVDDPSPKKHSSTNCSINPKRIAKDDATTYCAYAFLMWLQSNYDEAEKYFEKTILIQPNHPTAYRYLAEIAYMNKAWDRADLFAYAAKQHYLSSQGLSDYLAKHPAKKSYKDCDIVSIVMETSYPTERIQFIHAYVLQKLGRLTTAEGIYLELLKSEFSDPIAYLHLVDLHERQSQYGRAEDIIEELRKDNEYLGKKELFSFYKRMIARGVDTLDYHYKAGLLSYYSIPRQQLTAFAEIVKTDLVPIDNIPPSPDTMKAQYSNLLSGTDNKLVWATSVVSFTDEAHHHLKSITDIAPTHMRADVFHKLGDLYQYRYKKLNEAESYYVKASRLYENHGDLREKLIAYYTPRYRLNESYYQLKELQKRNQLSNANTVMLADFATKKGDYGVALKLIAKAKDCQLIRNAALEKTTILRLLLTEELRKASKKVEECIEVNDDPGNMHYTLARIHSLQGNHKKAIKEIERAISDGFAATWVLEYDPALVETREHKNYQPVRNLLPYFNPAQVN